MTYADAMRDYGSDKPDLRVPLKLTELTDLMRTVDFKVFRAAADLPNGRVAALRVPGGGTLTRKEIDDYTTFVKIYGVGGPRLHQGQRRRRSRTRKACSRRSSSSCRPRCWRRSSSAPARRPATSSSSAPTARRSSTTRSARCAPRSAHDRGLRRKRAGSRCGSSTSRCSNTTTRRRPGRARHHPFTAPKDGHEELFDDAIPATRSPRPTTSC